MALPAVGSAALNEQRIKFGKGARRGEVRVTYAFQCPEDNDLSDLDPGEDDDRHTCTREAFVTKEVFVFNKMLDVIWIKPLITFESIDFLKPRYDPIETITIEGFGLDFPDTEEDVPDFLLGLPRGFVKAIEALGLKATMKPLISQLNACTRAKTLTISRKRPTSIGDDEVVYFGKPFRFDSKIDKPNARQCFDARGPR